MATFKKPVFISVTTPVGVAVYPKLNAPDTKFKAGGEFSAKIRLTEEEAQPIIDKYEAALAKYFEEQKAELMAGDGKSKAKAKMLALAKDRPFKPEFDDEGEPNGFMHINFKMPHRITREGKDDLLLYPDIFDASGKKLKNVPAIWGGTKLAVAGQMRPFNTAIGVGMSLRLQAVQIIELVSQGSKDAGGYGFGASEGGYESDDEFPAGASDAPSSGNGEAPEQHDDF